MNKTFLLNSDLRSAPFLGSAPTVRGHWIVLQAYCSERENGGRIEGARQFTSKEWFAAMGTGGSARAAVRLVVERFAEWDGDDLVVRWYHHDSEARYRAQRGRGSLGGRAKAANERDRRQGHNSGEVVPSAATSSASSGPGEEREESDGEELPLRAEAGGGEPRDGRARSAVPRRAGFAMRGPGRGEDDAAPPPEDPGEPVGSTGAARSDDDIPEPTEGE